MASTPTYKNLTALIEQPNSGGIKYGERLQITKIYKGKLADCIADALARGTVGTGDLAGFVVAESTVTPERGGLGVLTIVWESGGSGASTPLPSDEVQVTPTNQSPRVERHPSFASLAAIDGELANVETACRAQNSAERNTAYATLSALGKKLVDKIRAGNESYYLATLRYSWATHSYTVPTTTRGGYVEAIGGPLASYFSGGIVWLREADDLQYSNGIWRRTISWLGADAWDADLYL